VARQRYNACGFTQKDVQSVSTQPKTVDYDPDALSEALNVITRIGVLMLQSGAASFRTKETMDRFAAILGIEQFDSFVTPTKIICIINSRQGNYTRAMRVPLLGVNMSRISSIHTMSHHPTEGIDTPAQLATWLNTVEAQKPNYSRSVVTLAAAAACGAFAIILGGGPLEMIAAICGAGTAQFTRIELAHRRLNPYFITAACSTIASVISYFIMRAIGAPLPRVGVIASVLLLVPGVPFVTALLDLIHLDLISGITRGVYAAILLINIGVGMLLVLALTGFSLL
jgi:uncharacterized membrane protein YjjP (DUF1212 family)